MIRFFFCNWVSTRWQWPVDLYKYRKETTKKKKPYTKQYKNNTKTQNAQNRKRKFKKNIKEH